MDIRCRRTVCEFNKGHTCFACLVDISKNAICKSFEKEKTIQKDDLDFSKKMFDVAPSYENSRHIKNIVLDCAAQNCVFNKNGKCQANGITVVDENGKSKCATFLCDLKI